MTLRFLVLVMTFALAACGSGGTTVPSGSVPQPTAPTPAATSAPTAPGVSAASVTFALPPRTSPSAHRRAPQYISPNATTFTSTIKTVNGSTTIPAGTPATVTTQLSIAAGGNCALDQGTGVTTCTVPVQTPPGTDTYLFQLTDTAPNVLAAANVTLAWPAAGPQQVQLRGVVSYVVAVPPSNLTYGTSFVGPFSVIGYDASGAVIGGSAPYYQPFMLCDGDQSTNPPTHTQLTVVPDGSPPGFLGTTAVCIPEASPNDITLFSYDGTKIPPFPLTAKGASILANSNGNPHAAGTNAGMAFPESPILIAGALIDDWTIGGSPSDPNFMQPTVFLFHIHLGFQTKSFSASQQDYAGRFTPSFTAVLDGTCGTGANALLSFAQTDAVTFRAQGLKHGLCFATVNGAGTSSQHVWFSV